LLVRKEEVKRKWVWISPFIFKPVLRNQESTSEMRFITVFKEMCGNKRELSKPHPLIRRNLWIRPVFFQKAGHYQV